MAEQGPVKKIQHGRVKASVWRNDSKNGPFMSVTFSRSYKDGEAYKDTHSFSAADLMNIIRAAADALAAIEALEEKKAA